MAALEKNNIYTARIEGYSSEGLGIARIDGQVVFVHGAVRGELCRVLVMKVLKNAAFGKVTELLEPSPERREPDCPYYGRCGGCDFRHLSYREELWAKRQRVQDALTRLGGSDVEVEEILGAADPLYYRNKSQYPVSAGKVGFYRARTHDVVDIEHCLIQKPQADAAATALRDYMRDFAVPSYDEKTGRGLLRHLYVRTNRRGKSLVCVLANGERLPHEEELVGRLRRAVPDCVGVVLGVNTHRGNTILGERYRTLWGVDTLEDELCGLTFRLSVPSFYQVNRDQAEVLYRKARRVRGPDRRGSWSSISTAASGTITQVMAGGAGRVIGAEIVPEAIEDAQRECAPQRHRKRGVLLRRRRRTRRQDFGGRGLRPDVMCGRSAAEGSRAPEVISAAAQMAPQRVVYVSCDPGNAGPGREALRGSSATEAQTGRRRATSSPGQAHVETVVLLSKGEVDSKKIRVEFSLEDMDMSEFQDGATYTADQGLCAGA